jgi:hypothetical protein
MYIPFPLPIRGFTLKLVPDKLVAYLRDKPSKRDPASYPWCALAVWLYLWRIDLELRARWARVELVSGAEKINLAGAGLPVPECRATGRRRGFQLSLITPWLGAFWCYRFQCWDRLAEETSLELAWNHVKGWRVGDGEKFLLREKRWVWWEETEEQRETNKSTA